MTPIQHSIIIKLFEENGGEQQQLWYVRAKKINIATLKSLLKQEMIITDKSINGVPTRFKLSGVGIEYGRQHSRNKRLSNTEST